jgi:hypothetical protein
VGSTPVDAVLCGVVQQQLTISMDELAAMPSVNYSDAGLRRCSLDWTG